MNSRIVERNGKQYRVTRIKHTQVMPWGTKPMTWYIAKWEKLDTQMSLFDE